MQYRAAVKSITSHVAVEAVLTAIDRSIKAGAPPTLPRAPLPKSGEWLGLSTAATAPSDFWFGAVGHRAKTPAAPLDR